MLGENSGYYSVPAFDHACMVYVPKSISILKPKTSLIPISFHLPEFDVESVSHLSQLAFSSWLCDSMRLNFSGVDEHVKGVLTPLLGIILTGEPSLEQGFPFDWVCSSSQMSVIQALRVYRYRRLLNRRHILFNKGKDFVSRDMATMLDCLFAMPFDQFCALYACFSSLSREAPTSRSERGGWRNPREVVRVGRLDYMTFTDPTKTNRDLSSFEINIDEGG